MLDDIWFDLLLLSGISLKNERVRRGWSCTCWNAIGKPSSRRSGRGTEKELYDNREAAVVFPIVVLAKSVDRGRV
jgi:hypothetical protein